ncbi:MAG: Smr/MutS family protein [Paracoccaceae bacterium]|nr:Smr/MutS family protein [Paracoccaceae bacterium]
MARRRALRPEEQELWQAVARTATPLHAPQKIAGLAAALAPEPRPSIAAMPPSPSYGRFRVGERAPAAGRGHDIVPALKEQLAAAPVKMDRKAFERMARGKLAPEARIDLHGMTMAEAHPELIRFILNASAQGLRLVLVITGKGKPGPDHGPIPQRHGVLKHQVPHWLHMPPLGPAILQVTEAHLRHGGSGAYYVYLRRHR